MTDKKSAKERPWTEWRNKVIKKERLSKEAKSIKTDTLRRETGDGFGWFLFNGILTFVGYLMPKQSLLKNNNNKGKDRNS